MARITNWRNKFAVAISGAFWSFRHQNSFWIHVPISCVVLGAAAWLKLEPWRWVAILLAMTIVISAELFNTAVECLVRAIHPEHDDQIGRALDIAAGAVLIAAVGAVAIGLVTLGPPLWQAVLG